MRNNYLILTGQEGNQAPQLLNLHQKLPVRKLTREHYKELPPFFLLDMRAGLDPFYPDILLNPLLLVSKEAMDVIKMYDEKMPFLFMALFDREQEESAVYFCPVLANGDRSCGEVLFRMETGREQLVIIREDLAESLLYRGATGMRLERLRE